MSQIIKFDNVDYPLNLIIGKRRSGKTTLIKNLIYAKQRKKKLKYDYLYVFSANNINDDWINIFPKNKIETFHKSTCDKYTIKKLIKIQEERKSNNKNSRCIIVFDDAILSNKDGMSKGLSNTDEFRNLVMRGRHLNIEFYLCCQYYTFFDKSIRSNADFIFCGKMNGVGYYTSMYQEVGESTENKKDFENFINENAVYHNFIFFNKSDDYQNKRMIIKAKIIPKSWKFKYNID